MPRNIAIFFDGTSNEAESNETNVLRMFRASEKSSDQICYYQPGVGTIPAVGTLWKLERKLTMWLGAGFGYGLTDNVAGAYRFLAEYYEPEDRIFIFGFSRGAFTARALAALLVECGLRPQHLENLDRYLVKAFQGSFAERGPNSPAGLYKDAFSRDVTLFSNTKPIHFLGLWDTVTSVGTLLSPARWPSVTTNPAVTTVRHAIALDERRAFFRQNRWSPSSGQDVKEVWFPGVHADVGGGYCAQDNLLWASSLFWMAKEARAAGLRLDSGKLIALFRQARAKWQPPAGRPRCSWAGSCHESYQGAWRVLERIPRPHKVYVDGAWKSEILFNLKGPRARTLRSGEILHPTVIRRLRRIPDWKSETLTKAKVTAANCQNLARAQGGYLVP